MGFRVWDVVPSLGHDWHDMILETESLIISAPHLLAWRRHDERPASEDIYGLSVLASDDSQG